MLRRRCVRREAIPGGGDATRLRSERPFPSASTSRQGGSARKRCASWYLVTAVQGCIDGAGRRWHSQATSPGTLPAMRCSASAARMGISFGEVGLGFSDLLTNDVHVRSGAYHPPSTTSTKELRFGRG